MTSRIPQFKTIQEEAEFWDTHDTTDFEDEMKPIQVSYKPQMEETMSVRFPTSDLLHLRQIAYKKGIGVTTLVRMIAREFLQKQPPSVAL
ncbi:MAG: hypothetical protein H6673_15535 [Anaerolineales bacterium]|nr:hypothetical protein [Anaerolineales bacterium]